MRAVRNRRGCRRRHRGEPPPRRCRRSGWTEGGCSRSRGEASAARAGRDHRSEAHGVRIAEVTTHPISEPRARAQRAEHGGVAQQLPRVVSTPGGESLQVLGPWIFERQPLTLLVDAAEVAAPGGDGEGQELVWPARGARLVDRREEVV